MATNIPTISKQARLTALGFPCGPIDGIAGKRTHEAERAALFHYKAHTYGELIGPQGLHRAHFHWTGGADGINDKEFRSYHFITRRDGHIAAGKFPPKANARPVRGKYAAHTFRANTGAIGITCDGMGGADVRERDAQGNVVFGKWPVTEFMLKAMARFTADLCVKHWIPVSRFSTLNHSEVQPTLGIRQKNKWDINCWPELGPRVLDPIKAGDFIRGWIIEALGDRQILSPKGIAAP